MCSRDVRGVGATDAGDVGRGGGVAGKVNQQRVRGRCAEVDVSARGRRTSTGWQTASRILRMERGRTEDKSDELVINALGVGRAVRRKERGWEVEEI
jgi:hypothetical protein